MILIADSGSTKTDWLLISDNGEQTEACTTKGINPFYQNSEEILSLLKNELTLSPKSVSHVYFYGAGCANREKNQIVIGALNSFLPGSVIVVNSDLLGAAHALCGNQPGIACILGTGSNSCFYDGSKIVNNVSPLGYIIGDEGSGAVIGKLLIGDILKNQLPESIIQTFFNEYNTSRDEILNHIYKQPFANRYLAQFTKFISENIYNNDLQHIVNHSFESFIKRNLLQYKNIHDYEINFTGSIAYHFEDQLKQALLKYNLSPGKICKTPMLNLAKYCTSLKRVNQ